MMKKKFTLIELLIVVAIIGILAALVLPALSRARVKAQLASCRSNLKNIGTLVGVYYTDGDSEVLPANWLSSTSPMAINDSLLSCPVKNLTHAYVQHSDSVDGEQYTGFGTSGLAQDETGVDVHLTSNEINIVYQDGSVHSIKE